MIKVGDKLIYKLNSHMPFNQTFEPIDDAYYYKKSYEIKKITDDECHFVDELGDDDYFFLMNVLFLIIIYGNIFIILQKLERKN